jgi:hypothetical protein
LSWRRAFLQAVCMFRASGWGLVAGEAVSRRGGEVLISPSRGRLGCVDLHWRASRQWHPALLGLFGFVFLRETAFAIAPVRIGGFVRRLFFWSKLRFSVGVGHGDRRRPVL